MKALVKAPWGWPSTVFTRPLRMRLEPMSMARSLFEAAERYTTV